MFVSTCSLLVSTPHLLKTASIYWMRGQPLDLSLMTMASLHSLHLFANDDLQPLHDGARAFPTVIIAGKFSRSACKKMGSIWMSLNMLPLLNKICESAASILNLIHISPKLHCPLPVSMLSFTVSQNAKRHSVHSERRRKSKTAQMLFFMTCYYKI
ncbi:hypothetical protein BDR04DRAFT_194291 [Suillus decipiens]|nr:hypothetical protein BDR04DRAFT_194291 [Suillus decipiens]